MLRDSLKATKLDHHLAEPRTWTPAPLAVSGDQDNEARGNPDTREPTPPPRGSSSEEACPHSGSLSSARGRARRPRSSPPRALPFSMVGRARRERRRAPGRGGAALGAEPREGRERPGRAPGDGWGGQLPGAAREDVATVPGCPSAPETLPLRSPEPPCLRRPGFGPSPPRCGPPGGRAAAAGEETAAAAAAALGYARCPAWVGSWGEVGVGRLLGFGPRRAVVRRRLLYAGRGLGLSLPRWKSPHPGPLAPVPLQVPSKKAFHLWGQ